MKNIYLVGFPLAIVIGCFISRPTVANAACPTGSGACGSVSGCPTGDASIGINFTGLSPVDVNPQDPNKTVEITVTGTTNDTYTCTYANSATGTSGVAGKTASCKASYNSATDNIECQINHLDCRNGNTDCPGGTGSFNVFVSSQPPDYNCVVSPLSIPLSNCFLNDKNPLVSCSIKKADPAPPPPTTTTYYIKGDVMECYVDQNDTWQSKALAQATTITLSSGNGYNHSVAGSSYNLTGLAADIYTLNVGGVNNFNGPYQSCPGNKFPASGLSVSIGNPGSVTQNLYYVAKTHKYSCSNNACIQNDISGTSNQSSCSDLNYCNPPDCTTPATCTTSTTCKPNNGTCGPGQVLTKCVNNCTQTTTTTPTPCDGPVCSVGQCSVLASALDNTTIRGSASAGSGYDRFDWYLDTQFSAGFVGTNAGPTADFTGLTPGSSHTIFVKAWSSNRSVPATDWCQSSKTLGSSPGSPIDKVCFRGNDNCSNTGNGIWHADSTGCICGCPQGTTPNIFDQNSVGGVCFTPPVSSTPSNNRGLYVRFLVRNSDGTETLAPRNPDNTSPLYPFWWFISSSVNNCTLTGTYFNNTPAYQNGAVLCYQGSIVGGPPSYVDWFYANGGGSPPANPFTSDTMKIVSWGQDYKPIGYYDLQETLNREGCDAGYTHCDPTAKCPNDSGGCDRLACVSCGGVGDCIAEDCHNNAYACQRTATTPPFSSFTPPGPTRGTLSTVAGYCIPGQNGTQDDDARIDLVFQKAIYQISGTVFIDSNGNGIKDATETQVPTTSGNVLALNGTTQSASVSFGTAFDSVGHYSFTNLRGGSYSLGLNLPGYRFIPAPASCPASTTCSNTAGSSNSVTIPNLDADKVVNFAVLRDPGAWIKTIGGDTNANEGFTTPGGPQ